MLCTFNHKKRNIVCILPPEVLYIPAVVIFPFEL